MSRDHIWQMKILDPCQFKCWYQPGPRHIPIKATGTIVLICSIGIEHTRPCIIIFYICYHSRNQFIVQHFLIWTKLSLLFTMCLYKSHCLRDLFIHKNLHNIYTYLVEITSVLSHGSQGLPNSLTRKYLFERKVIHNSNYLSTK